MSEVKFGETQVMRLGFPKLKKLFKYNLISYVVSLILITILSALICYTDIPEKFSVSGVKIITFISVFVAGFLYARSASGKGWLAGAVSGLFNMGILLILAVALNEVTIRTTPVAIKLLCGAIIGSFGGIFGINSKR